MTLNCHKACEETRRFRVISILLGSRVRLLFSCPGFLDETGGFLYNRFPKGSGAVEQVLTKEYYIRAHETYGCYEGVLELLLAEVQRLQENPADGEVFLALYRAIGEAAAWDDSAVIPEGVTMLSAMAVLAHMPAMIEGLLSDGFDRDMAVATAKDVAAETLEAALDGGIPGMDAHLVKWFLKYILRQIVRIGRLNYERLERFPCKVRIYRNAQGEDTVFAWDFSVNKDGGAVQEGEEEAFFAAGQEDGTLVTAHRIVDGKVESTPTTMDVADCRLMLKQGDAVIRTHIPAFEPFTPDIVAASYKKALPVLLRCWPDLQVKAIACKSWMMSPELRKLLPEKSNLLAFQRPYRYLPSKGNITSAISCVFRCSHTDYASLPEKSGLQRTMKAHYLAGGVVRFDYGYILIEDFRKEFCHE